MDSIKVDIKVDIIKIAARLPLLNILYAAGVTDGRKAAAADIKAAPLSNDPWIHYDRAAYIAEGRK